MVLYLVCVHLLEDVIGDVNTIIKSILHQGILELFRFNVAISVPVKVGEGLPEVLIICHSLQMEGDGNKFTIVQCSFPTCVNL